MNKNSEKRICQNCKKDFIIEPDDFGFYEKIKVPAPTFCPECRMIRRFSFQNTWNLNWRNCDRCGNRIISVYDSETKITVYCLNCWWSDIWDGSEYTMDYDPSRPFLDQVKELIDKTPYSSLQNDHVTLKNSDYSNYIGWSKDCYLVFWADFCDNVFYSSILNTLRYSSDCLRAQDSELCYESINIDKCYQTFFSEECDSCVNVWFCRNCYGCINCFGCANLHGASNCILNVKYSKEKYIKKLKEFKVNSWQKLQELKQKAQDFWITKPRREYAGNSLNFNVTGEYIYESKNSRNLYICDGAEDCKWTQLITVKTARDCMDYSGWGNNSSRIYECINVGENTNSIYFSCFVWEGSMDMQYCYWCMFGKDNFGCVNLKRKQYCILNKQYTKEEYFKLKGKIIEHMIKTGEWGEFFPMKYSPFAYNESIANLSFSMTKNEIINSGLRFQENLQQTKGKTTLRKIPEDINDVPDNILNEILECVKCKRNYKIIQNELSFYRKWQIPIPRKCFFCRLEKRFSLRTPSRVWHRKCMKEGCQNEFETSYAPDRLEIIYCESCYNKEVY